MEVNLDELLRVASMLAGLWVAEKARRLRWGRDEQVVVFVVSTAALFLGGWWLLTGGDRAALDAWIMKMGGYSTLGLVFVTRLLRAREARHGAEEREEVELGELQHRQADLEGRQAAARREQAERDALAAGQTAATGTEPGFLRGPETGP